MRCNSMHPNVSQNGFPATLYRYPKCVQISFPQLSRPDTFCARIDSLKTGQSPVNGVLRTIYMTETVMTPILSRVVCEFSNSDRCMASGIFLPLIPRTCIPVFKPSSLRQELRSCHVPPPPAPSDRADSVTRGVPPPPRGDHWCLAGRHTISDVISCGGARCPPPPPTPVYPDPEHTDHNSQVSTDLGRRDKSDRPRQTTTDPDTERRQTPSSCTRWCSDRRRPHSTVAVLDNLLIGTLTQ